VVEAGRQDPEKFGSVVEEMDRTGKIDPAYKEAKGGAAPSRAKQAAGTSTAPSALEKVRAPLPDGSLSKTIRTKLQGIRNTVKRLTADEAYKDDGLMNPYSQYGSPAATSRGRAPTRRMLRSSSTSRGTTAASFAMDSPGSPRGLAAAMRMTRALISALTGGRPRLGRTESLVQYSRKRRRCQRRRCLGSQSRERASQGPASPTQKRRSVAVSLGRAAALLYTATRWGRARFSRTSWRWPPQRNREALFLNCRL
jgi:hypothetical protein